MKITSLKVRVIRAKQSVATAVKATWNMAF